MKSMQNISKPCEKVPSLPKGKGTDPLNWGNIGIDPTELDAEAQRTEIEFFESQRKTKHATGEKPKTADSPKKDPEETAQESSEPREKTKKSQKRNPGQRRPDLKCTSLDPKAENPLQWKWDGIY
jgi:hypothetical protein